MMKSLNNLKQVSASHKIVKEHEKLCFLDNNAVFNCKRTISGETGYLLSSTENNPCWFFKWDSAEKEDGSGTEYAYFASYTVGAQWLNDKDALVILPKKSVQNIDYIKMFMTCLKGGMSSEYFSQIYQIDFSGKRIKTKLASTVLDPLLLCHFLGLVERISSKGLKKGYIYRNENLKKCKGRIDIYKNDRKNIITGRCDRVYCSYYDYGVNIPENKILKRALLISKNIYSQLNNTDKQSLSSPLRKCLRLFDEVDDDIQISEIQNYKTNKLYKDYSEAIELAKMILHYSGYTVFESNKNEGLVPPFWINMPALFEYYLLYLMREQYGERIRYQDDYQNGFKFGWRPDYLFVDEENAMIIDAKYIPDLKTNDEKMKNYVRQLAGYSRIDEIRDFIGVENDQSVPCVLIYTPSLDSKVEEEINAECDFTNIELSEDGLKDYEIKGVHKFYLLPIRLPTIS